MKFDAQKETKFQGNCMMKNIQSKQGCIRTSIHAVETLKRKTFYH